MDITIWRVRPSQASDVNERFLAPSIRILKPVSNEPIAVPGRSILHLTDLHFASGTHNTQHRWDVAAGGPRGTLADQVGTAVAASGIGIVLISGDFTFIAHEEEFLNAEKSVNALLGTLGLGPDNLVIIPGNHDIAWTSTATGYDPKSAVTFAPAPAKAAYESFYKRLMRHLPNNDLSMGRRFVLPEGQLVDMCALNSSSLEQGANYLAGMGRVTPAAFGRVRDVLGWKSPAALSLRILTVHHHLTATEDLEDPSEFTKGFGMAIDAKQILRDAAKSGTHLILHGHRHRVFVWNEGVYAKPEFTEPVWNLGKVGIVGGGSVGSTSVDGNRNFFNVLEINPSNVKLKIFRSNNSSPFERMATWVATTNLTEGQISLSDWTPELPAK